MRWLHPDAADMWKMTMSLSNVTEACADPSKRLPRQACPIRSMFCANWNPSPAAPQ